MRVTKGIEATHIMRMAGGSDRKWIVHQKVRREVKDGGCGMDFATKVERQVLTRRGGR